MHLLTKSLFDWEAMILHWDIPYVQDKTNSNEGKKKQIKLGGLRLTMMKIKKYTMRDDDFVSTDKDNSINVEIKKVTPKEH